jgi:uncharacterized phage protein (TIGR02218 family)
MTFETTEKSLYDAQPIELFEFIGTLNTYRMTTYAEDVVSSGNTFTPLAGLARSVLKTGTQEEENLALDITLPFDHPLVVEYAYKTAPPSLQLTVYRAHVNNPSDRIVMWEGKVLSFSVTGRHCKMRVPALFAYLLNGVAPAPRYQAPCNHVLYDGRCAVNPASHQVVATVDAITNNLITIDSFGAITATDTIGGDMSWSVGGEDRMITAISGLDLTVTYPFANLTVGQTVTIRRGCDHSFTQCKARFSNGINFGGYPLVPDKNPFTSRP